MTKPLLYPEWAATDTTLPATGNTNKQRPKESLRNIGWDKGQIPTAEEWNWQFDNIFDWIVWFNENNLATKTFALTGDVGGTVNYTNENGFSVTTTIQPNSVSLGSDTTGNYVATASVSGNGLSGSSSTEGGTFTVNSNAVSTNNPNTLMYRDGNGDVAARYFVGIATGADAVNTILGNISILSGTISNGGTIPLPSGYTEGQCKWIVSVDNSNSNSTAWDWQEGVSSNHIYHRCYTTGRIVTATTTVLNETGNITYDATANYIIIGYK